MGTSNTGSRIIACAAILASVTIAGVLPAGSVASSAVTAATKNKGKPHVETGPAQHVSGTSADLTATVSPAGIPTSYQFQYGATTAYGQQTTLTLVGSQTTKVKVSQAVAGLAIGGTYHYRVVGVTSTGVVLTGKDHSFKTKGKAKIEMPKSLREPVGSTFILSGAIKGFEAAGRAVVLQASPYPYTEAFTTIGAPAVTNSAGRFSFRVSNLSRSTEFRVTTVEAHHPLRSPTITVRATLRVFLHIKKSSTGLVRLYGTVTPSAVGASVNFEVLKAARPTRKREATTKYESQFSTVTKKGSKGSARFSIITSIITGGTYRAYVRIKTGAYSSGYSQTIVLHATKSKTKKKKKK
jgi:hypothetical protein